MVVDIKQIQTGVVALDNLTMSEAVQRISESNSSSALDIVLTPNIDHLARLIKETAESSYKTIYETANMRLCDSRIFQKLLKAKGHSIKEVIPGSSLTKELFDSNVLLDRNIAIIGGSETVYQRLCAKYPNHSIVHYNPPMGFINSDAEVDKTIRFCIESKADVFFLAVGSPRQEILAAAMKKSSLGGVALCIGASILFLVDEQKRAPIWMQKLCLEWFYRLLQEPKRLAGRYFSNFLDLYTIYRAL